MRQRRDLAYALSSSAIQAETPYEYAFHLIAILRNHLSPEDQDILDTALTISGPNTEIVRYYLCSLPVPAWD